MPLFCAGIVCVMAETTSSSLARELPDCSDGPTVRVSVSGVIFAVPIGYRTQIRTIALKSLRPHGKFAHPLCRKGLGHQIQEPVEAESIFILRYVNQGAPIDQLPHLAPDQLHIYSHPSGRSFDLREAHAFLDQVKQSGRQLENLPKIGGFYAYERKENSQLYRSSFMSLTNQMRTPTGHPVVVTCLGNYVPAPGLASPAGRVASCQIYYDWAPGIGVRYDFSIAQYPMEKWVSLYADVRAFIEKMIVAPRN